METNSNSSGSSNESNAKLSPNPSNGLTKPNKDNEITESCLVVGKKPQQQHFRCTKGPKSKGNMERGTEKEKIKEVSLFGIASSNHPPPDAHIDTSKVEEKIRSTENTLDNKKSNADIPKNISSNLLAPSSYSLAESKQTIPSSVIPARKHGKTPGRERRKELNSNNNNITFDGTSNSTGSSSSSIASSVSSYNSKNRYEGKQKNKVITALNFNTLMPIDGPTNIATAAKNNKSNSTGNRIGSGGVIKSRWSSSSPVSFSEVLQSQNSPIVQNSHNVIGSSNKYMKFNDIKCQTSASSVDHHLPITDLNFSIQKNTSTSLFTETSLPHAIFDEAKTSPLQAEPEVKDKSNCPELGPIGSRKSPSSTPIWEPLVGISSNSGTMPMIKPTILNNSSFFSNILPPPYGYDHGQSFTGIPTVPALATTSANPYELNKVQEEMRRQWQSNNYILNLNQHQPFQGQTGQQFLHDMDEPNNWATGASNINPSSWSPMGYNQSISTSTVGNNTSHGHKNSLGSWTPITVDCGCNSAGNNSSGGGVAVRPPPGLESNFPHASVSNTQSTQASVEQNRSSDVTPQSNTAGMQPFDPFSSLSSIWSENWHV